MGTDNDAEVNKKIRDEFEEAKWQCLLEGCVWRKYREVFNTGLPSQKEKFLVLSHEKAGDMHATVELKGEKLQFEVTWGDNSYSFER